MTRGVADAEFGSGVIRRDHHGHGVGGVHDRPVKQGD